MGRTWDLMTDLQKYQIAFIQVVDAWNANSTDSTKAVFDAADQLRFRDQIFESQWATVVASSRSIVKRIQQLATDVANQV